MELPGIEPDGLPGNTPSELPVHFVSFRFSPARCLRIRFRVLTTSRAVTDSINRLSARIGSSAASPILARHFGHGDRSGVRESTLSDISGLPVRALVVCGVTRQDTAVGRAAEAIVSELRALDIGVIVSRSADDAAAVVASDPGLGVIVADWALTQEGDGSTLVDRVRAQNEDIPLFLMTTRGSLESTPRPTPSRSCRLPSFTPTPRGIEPGPRAC